MRLFIALIPPPEIREHLSDFLDPRREAGPDLRWSDPDQLHLTLAFIADHPQAGLDRLTDALAQRCARLAPGAVRLVGGTAFPNPYVARVLALGAEPEVWLAATARAIRHTAGHAGADVDGGRFRPHLTIARLRRPVEATRWVRILQAYESAGWVADSVALVSSHLGQGRAGRPRYDVLAQFPLGAATPGD